MYNSSIHSVSNPQTMQSRQSISSNVRRNEPPRGGGSVDEGVENRHLIQDGTPYSKSIASKEPVANQPEFRGGGSNENLVEEACVTCTKSMEAIRRLGPRIRRCIKEKSGCVWRFLKVTFLIAALTRTYNAKGSIGMLQISRLEKDFSWLRI